MRGIGPPFVGATNASLYTLGTSVSATSQPLRGQLQQMRQPCGSSGGRVASDAPR